MDSIEFIGIIAVFAGILAWYIHNMQTGAGGHAGLLALRQDAGAPKPKPPASQNRTTTGANQIPADHSGGGVDVIADEANSQRKFRRREEARYRVMDKAARYRPKKTNRPL